MEFENLLYDRWSWVFVILYAVGSLMVSISSYLQEAYFSAIASVPVMFINMVAPIFIVIILAMSLSQVFAKETEDNTDQIPNTCYLGSKGRNICKVISGILYTIFIVLLISAITFIVCLITNHFLNADVEIIRYIGDELTLNFSWNIWQHFTFGIVALLMGSIIFSLIVLLVSYLSKSTLTAISITVIFTIFEFLFNRFSFPMIPKEVNVWAFLQPYYLYVFNIFNYSPYINLFLLFFIFLIIILILSYSAKIIKRIRSK